MWRRMIPLGLLALGLPLAATAQEKEEQEKPESPKRLAARVQLAQIGMACTIFKVVTGEDPQSLAELVKRPDRVKNWPEGGFLPGWQDVPLDPWGNAYVYKPSGRVPDVRTLGADGRPGGEGEDEDLTLEAAMQKQMSIEEGERAAASALKWITVAEADFRSNDRDGNRVNDFWTGDVYALYALCPIPAGAIAQPEKPNAVNIIKLIPPELAEADAMPLKQAGLAKAAPDKPKPYKGYLFRAFDSEDSGSGAVPLKRDTDGGESFYGEVHDRNRFAFCAYPAKYGKTGRLTFIVNEDNTIWSKDTAGEPLKDFPASPAKAGWKKVD